MSSAAINLNDWVARRESKEDVIAPWLIKGLSATFELHYGNNAYSQAAVGPAAKTEIIDFEDQRAQH